MTDLEKYWNRLNAFDYLYPMSDDPNVFDRGWAEERELRHLAGTDERHKRLYDQFWSYWHGNGNPPPRPKD